MLGGSLLGVRGNLDPCNLEGAARHFTQIGIRAEYQVSVWTRKIVPGSGSIRP